MTSRRAAGAAPSLLTRSLRPSRPKPPEARSLALTSPVRRVLAIKHHDQLGDFLVATPALRALRERYPNARIVLVTREFLAPLARRVPLVDDVWVLPALLGGRGLGRWMEAVGAVAGFRPDLAWVLNSVSRSKTADAIAAVSRAKVVIGRSRVGAGPLPDDAPSHPVEAGLGERDAVYDLDVSVGHGSVHQVDRVLDLVRWATGEPSSASLVLEPSAGERREAQQALARVIEESGAGSGRPVVGLHPGAANTLKCWPLESFVELGAALATSEEAPALAVFDSPRERGRAAALCAGLAARGVQAAFLPASSIDRFAALCSRLAVLVCNDSGVAHIASALGVPTISFHSLGDPREWGPRGRRAITFHAPGDIAMIPASAAVEAVRVLLRAPVRDSVGEEDATPSGGR